MLRLPLLAALLLPASAALGAPDKAPAQASADPVIGCVSLANLRSLLRNTKDDKAAALAAIRDPKADLGCSIIDRAAVTEITDHVVLNGRAYDCLAIKGTAVCRWIVAGAVAPPEKPAGKSKK